MAQAKLKSKPDAPSMEARVEALERSVRALEAVDDPVVRARMWVRRMAGSFENDHDNLEAARLGAEYRRRQPKC